MDLGSLKSQFPPGRNPRGMRMKYRTFSLFSDVYVSYTRMVWVRALLNKTPEAVAMRERALFVELGSPAIDLVLLPRA